MKIEPKILKGFRDFLPKEAKKRQYVISTLKQVFELYGFEPLETPALEYEEILSGKYGEEGDKLMYKFEDLGKRKVALRYDQTVPLARVVAQYGNELPMPFKRYQVQPVWRAENPQRGRFREFLQCDADIVGSSSPLSDAEVIAVAAKTLEKLGFNNFKLLINDRTIFSNFVKKDLFSDKSIQIIIRSLDKLKKIDREGVLNEMIEKGIPANQATYAIQAIESMKPTERVIKIFKELSKMGLQESNFEFCPTLARGLDYYTGIIFEVEIEGYSAGSVCGGGRYDNLIGMFTDKKIPAVGFAFGFDRLIEAMEELKLFPSELDGAKVLVTIFPARNASSSVAGGSPEFKDRSIELCSRLRSENIKTELYLDENAKLDKQLKYADQKGIKYVVIIGPSEIEKDLVILKDMKTGEQKEIKTNVIPNLFRDLIK